MRKKHYVAIAYCLKRAIIDAQTEAETRRLRLLARHLAEEFARDNASFSQVRFLTLSGTL